MIFIMQRSRGINSPRQPRKCRGSMANLMGQVLNVKIPMWLFIIAITPSVLFGQKITQKWAKALKRAGIENFWWRDLRHTWASWHVQNGTPLHILQELGGWSSYEMVNRYALCHRRICRLIWWMLKLVRILCGKTRIWLCKNAKWLKRWGERRGSNPRQPESQSVLIHTS